MAIAVYFKSVGTVEQYDEVMRRLDESDIPGVGAISHAAFINEDGRVSVFDLWRSRENWEAFAEALFPILQEVGIDTSRGYNVYDVHNHYGVYSGPTA
jgi:hypothetical protein